MQPRWELNATENHIFPTLLAHPTLPVVVSVTTAHETLSYNATERIIQQLTGETAVALCSSWYSRCIPEEGPVDRAAPGTPQREDTSTTHEWHHHKLMQNTLIHALVLPIMSCTANKFVGYFIHVIIQSFAKVQKNKLWKVLNVAPVPLSPPSLDILLPLSLDSYHRHPACHPPTFTWLHRPTLYKWLNLQIKLTIIVCTKLSKLNIYISKI